MKKGVICVFVLLFAISFVIAAEDFFDGMDIGSLTPSQVEALKAAATGDSGVDPSDGDGWDQTNVNDTTDNDTEDEVDTQADVGPGPLDDYISTPASEGGTYDFTSEKRFTLNFYIAVIVAIVGILLVLLFVYLFFKNPKNRWRKKVVHGTTAPNGKNRKMTKR